MGSPWPDENFTVAHGNGVRGHPMAQVVIFGHRAEFDRPGRKREMSEVIHGCFTAALGLPADKRFHRFIALDGDSFYHPPDRSQRYTVIEVRLFAGRTIQTKKSLHRLLFARCESDLGIMPQDLEITLMEQPRENWGIRGLPGDELPLPYKI